MWSVNCDLFCISFGGFLSKQIPNSDFNVEVHHFQISRVRLVCPFAAARRGWEQTNFVELWSVSRPRLAEIAIEIWVMCQLTEKLFETSSVR